VERDTATALQPGGGPPLRRTCVRDKPRASLRRLPARDRTTQPRRRLGSSLGTTDAFPTRRARTLPARPRPRARQVPSLRAPLARTSLRRDRNRRPRRGPARPRSAQLTRWSRASARGSRTARTPRQPPPETRRAAASLGGIRSSPTSAQHGKSREAPAGNAAGRGLSNQPSRPTYARDSRTPQGTTRSRRSSGLRSLAGSWPVAVAVARLAAEFACRATRAVEDDLVLPVIVEVDEVTLPAIRASRRALPTLNADKHHRHSEDDRARRRSALVTVTATAQVSTRLQDAPDAKSRQPAAAPKTFRYSRCRFAASPFVQRGG
jgi:hypothetical protein